MIKRNILIVLSLILLIAIIPCFLIAKKQSNYKKIEHAICNNDIQELEAILQNGVDPNTSNTLTNNGMFEKLTDSKHTRFTALQYAAFLGNDEAIKLLLDYGANPNYCPDSIMYSALTRAVMNEEINIKLSTVQLLVENGADVNSSSNEGRHVLNWLINNYSPNNQFGYDDVEIFRYLVENGADVFAEDYLFLACKMGKGDIIHYLISECGYLPKHESYVFAYCEAINDLSQSTFDFEIFSLLLNHGANINEPVKNGMSVKDYLMSIGREEWLKQKQ